METKATLYLNMIIGDFEAPEIVKRSIDSVKDSVDGIYVTVTYKEEKPEKSALLDLLKEYKVNLSFYKWTYNFSEARQFALQQVPKGSEIFVYWQDADDVLYNPQNLHKIADEMIQYKESAIYFDYWYQVELDDSGEVREILVKHKRERIIINDDTWKWIGPLHETLIEQKQENLIRHFRPECYVVHLTSNDRLNVNIDRNVEILEETAKREQHKDPRTVIYLAKAYFDQAKMQPDPAQRKIKLDLALMLFHQYLNGSGQPGEAGYIERSGWSEERSTAWSYIAEIAILTGHPEVAIGAYQNAIDEAPQFPNYYVDMAMCYVMMDDFKKAEHWLNVATSIPEPETTIIQFPRDIKTRALEVSFHVNMNKQKLEWALEDAKKIMDILPNDQLAKDRIKTITSLVEYNKACQSFVYLGKYLEQIKALDKLGNLVQAIPDEMKQEKFAAEMQHLFLPSKIWADNEIAIVCGPGFEKWSPDSIQTGLGGSEEAVVYMSNELTKLGWKVTVYANPEKPGNYDGVEYRVWHEVNVKDAFNVLILWRNIGFVDVNPVAKYTMVWLHDTPNNPDFTEERLNKVDKVMVLSEYHKSLLRVHKNGLFEKFPENKVLLTTNGIPTVSVPKVERLPHRIIYSSSADRGLIYLLMNWEKIKEQVEDAELHVFYGFEIFDKLHQNNPARVEWKNRVLTLMKKNGIIYHGRIGHNALNYEFAKSAIWAYPTDFTEISCITAMKAQKFGAIPVVTDYAALTETVKNGLRVDVDITSEEGQVEYFDALIGLLKDTKKQEEIRESMMKWADSYYDWSNVAKLWDERLRVELQNPERKKEEYADTNKQIKSSIGKSTDSKGGDVQSLQTSDSGEKQISDIGRTTGNNEGNSQDKETLGNTPNLNTEKEVAS